MAQNEYEAKFLEIDVEATLDALRTAGAQQVFRRTMFTRLIFENDAVQGEQWLRLRDEGGRTTLTLKQVTDATHIHGTTEIEVDDLSRSPRRTAPGKTVWAQLHVRTKSHPLTHRVAPGPTDVDLLLATASLLRDDLGSRPEDASHGDRRP